MSGLLTIMYCIFLFCVILIVIKNENKKAVKKTTPSQAQIIQKDNAAQSKFKSAPAADPSKPKAFFGEGEDPAEHQAHLMRDTFEGETEESRAAHLMKTDQEGEPEEEHKAHIEAAEHRERVENAKAAAYASALKADRDALKRAVVMREVLGKPVALRSRCYNCKR